MKVLKLLLFLVFLLPLAGCKRSTQVTHKLCKGMNKSDVKRIMGSPEFVSCPRENDKGETVDLWEYSLYTLDDNADDKKMVVCFVAGLVFWPLLIVFPFMESSYNYETYVLEFVDSLLNRWGRRSEFARLKLARI